MPIEVDPSQVHSIEVDPSQVTAAAAPAAVPSGLDHLVDAARRYASNLGEQINPVKMLQGLSAAGNHPIDAIKGTLAAQGHVADEAADSIKTGDYATGVKHALLYLLPLIGPQIDQISNQGAQGDLAGAMGAATGAGLMAALPDAPAVKAAAGKTLSVLPRLANPNAVERAATQFGVDHNIPVSAATATGNKFVAGAQKLADHSALGSIVAQKAATEEASAFTRVGNELASQVHPTPVVPTQAGLETSAAIQKVISDQHAEATKNYTALRSIEADPANAQTVQTGTKQVPSGVLDAAGNPIVQTVPVTETMGLPVDLRAGKDALRPIRDQIVRQLPVTQQRASAGLHAINNVLDGPDFAPASQVDMDLGTIKGIARGADLPELKDLGQSLASKAVNELENAVQTSVAKAAIPAGSLTGSELLKNGRAATVAKYDAADVLQSLRTDGQEGRQVFDQAIWNKDAGVENLKRVAAVAPDALPKLGRAYLEDMFSTAAAEGGFNKTQSLWNRWQNLGPQTKQVLFKNPLLIKDLDNFFLLAKKAAENPNPSGSTLLASVGGQTGYMFVHPVSGVPMVLGAGALSKMLHSPTGVRALTEGLKLPAGEIAARAASSARILKAAASVGAKPTTLPMAAANSPSSQSEKSALLASR